MSLTMFGAWLVTSVVVALAGPFGTFSTQSFSWRLLYWGALIAIAIVLAISLRTLWRNILQDRPSWQEDIAVSLSLAAVFGPLVVSVNRELGGEPARDAMGVGLAMMCVLGIALAIIAVRREMSPTATASMDEDTPRDRLFTRLSAQDGARLSRISSDNHYIRIVTRDGEEHRLLMRLRDAVQEVDVEPGVCVHRSHWVALSSITKVVRDGPRELVELPCGYQIPVGPKYRSNLVNAGFINE